MGRLRLHECVSRAGLHLRGQNETKALTVESSCSAVEDSCLPFVTLAANDMENLALDRLGHVDDGAQRGHIV